MKKLIYSTIITVSLFSIAFLTTGFKLERFKYDYSYEPSIHIDILDKNINIQYSKAILYPLLLIDKLPLLDVEFIPRDMDISKRILPKDKIIIDNTLGYCILLDFMYNNITIPTKTDKYDLSKYTISSRASLLSIDIGDNKQDFEEELQYIESIYIDKLVPTDNKHNTIVKTPENTYAYCYSYSQDTNTLYCYNPRQPKKVLKLNADNVDRWEVSSQNDFKIYGDV